MFSLRLHDDMERQLDEIATSENISRSAIVKEALRRYITDYEKKHSPFKLGEELFGRHGSGRSDLSTSYRKEIKGKIRDKMSR